MNNKNWKKIGSLALVLIGLIAGSYYLFKRFLRDRQSALNFEKQKITILDRSAKSTRETKIYTQEELEKMKREGKLPRGVNPAPTLPPGTNAAENVQRTLRTVEEINRINEMNRRLMEQQQKMQQNNR